MTFAIYNILYMSKMDIIAIILSVITLVSSFNITPLQAGTFVFDDKVLRLNTCITKTAVLPFSQQYYSSHQDIQTIAAINSLSMNQHLNFYFRYQIKCITNTCFLELNLGRYTEVVDPDFKYGLTIDYLVAHGLKVINLNMTWYKATAKMASFKQYEIQTSPSLTDDLENDDWQMILVPNGFSNISLTGFITETRHPNADTFGIKFKDQNYGAEMHMPQIWPLNGKYILYAIVFVPRQYLSAQRCKLNDNCIKQSIQFSGFKWTKSSQIDGVLTQEDNNYVFQTNINRQNYQLFNLPLEGNSKFIDSRKHQSFLTVQMEYAFNGIAKSIDYVYVVAVVLILLVAYISLKKLRNKSRNCEAENIVSKTAVTEAEKKPSTCLASTQQSEPSIQDEISSQQQ